jgi:hypothetical protein
MTMLTAAELSALRTDVLETLPDTCVILRATATNSNGYPSEAWGTAVASAACRLDPVRQQDAGVIADREAGVTYWQLTLAYDADVADGDRIVHSSVTYEVQQLHGTHSNRIVKRATVAKVG